ALRGRLKTPRGFETTSKTWLPRGGRGRLNGLVPAERIARIVELAGEGRQPQRVERVAHHRELLGPGRADRLLDQPRLGAVRQAARVERDRADLDAAPRAELP